MPLHCVLTSPFGANLEFHRMRVSERLSQLYEIELEAVSLRDDLEPKKILGHRINVKVDFGDGSVRHFDGFVTRFALGMGQGRRFLYRLHARPALWFLTRTSDCRIFQGDNLLKILQKVLEEGHNRNIKPDSRLLDKSVYKDWEYCVQYRESDFSFVARLMEQEGMYWFHEHSASGHQLVLIDDKSKHVAIPGGDTFQYVPDSPGQVHTHNVITHWRQVQQVQPAVVTLKDYDWLKPASEQKVSRSPEHEHEHGQASAKYEVFDYPGDFDPADGQALAQGEPYVAARAEEFAVDSVVLHGQGLLHRFQVGQRFKMTHHPRRDQNGEYLIIGTEYEFLEPTLEAASNRRELFSCSFTALPQRQQFRPARVTRRPLIHGHQTAIVTGHGQEEIHTDKHGRIKVKFHWDRHGPTDDKSSCYLRVSTLAAGNTWGFISIPRVGQEVLVSFLEGDPDRPVVTGMVYNGNNPPPWALPDNKTQWGMLSRSSEKGSPANANALRFEDKKGHEEVWLHAERNQRIEVENDETHTVGHDRTKKIGNDETSHIGNDRTETVGRHEHVTIKKNRTLIVNEGDELIEVQKGKTEVKIKTTYSLIAEDQITLTSGASSLTMKKDGTIVLAGKDITIKTDGGSVKIDNAGKIVASGTHFTGKTGGGEVDINTGGVAQLKGTDTTIKAGPGSVNINTGGIVTAKGPMVKLNT